jgi:hypothetical protein
MLERREYKINTLDINKNRGIGIANPFDPVNEFKIRRLGLSNSFLLNLSYFVII